MFKINWEKTVSCSDPPSRAQYRPLNVPELKIYLVLGFAPPELPQTVFVLQVVAYIQTGDPS